MFTYIYRGRVLPEHSGLSLRVPLTGPIQDLVGTTFHFQLSLNASVVSVLVNSATETDIFFLKNGVEGLVQAEVDAIGYVLGAAYRTVIDSVVALPSGELTAFGPQVEELRDDSEAAKRDFAQLGLLAISDMHLRRALADLREAILSPVDTAFFCYRAIENLSRHFGGGETPKERNAAWAALREALRLEREWIDYVKGAADPVRHGGVVMLPGSERLELLRRTKIVLGLYLQWVNQKRSVG